jgi:hypothetical protein
MEEGKFSRRVNVSAEGTKTFASLDRRRSWDTLALRVDPGKHSELHDIHSIGAEQRAIASRVPGVAPSQKKSRSSQKKDGGFFSRLFRS